MGLDLDKLDKDINDIAAPVDAGVKYRQAMMEAMSSNPDTAAKALPIARDRGIPIDMAERNMETLQRDAAYKRVLAHQVTQKSPSLAEWLTDKENARIAHDDIGTLTTLADYGKSLAGGVISTVGGVVGSVGTILEAEAPLFRGPMGEAAMLVGKALRKDVSRPVREFTTGLVPQERMTFGKEVAGAVGQMVTMVAGGIVSGSMKAGGLIAGAVGADEMATRAEDAGATQGEKILSATAAGAVTYATELPVIKLIAGRFPWFSKMLAKAPSHIKGPFMNKMADLSGAGLAEFAQEGVENPLYNVIEHFVFNPDKEIFEDVLHQAQVGGVTGVVSRGLIMAMGGNLRGRKDGEQLQKVKNESRLATESPLRARSPEKFKEAIQAMRGDAEYYIPMEAGRTFFQGLNDADADKLSEDFPDLKKKIAEAQNTGSDIMISQAEYLTYLAPLDTKQILAGVLKAHQEMDVMEAFPDLADIVPKTGTDPDGDALQARMEKEMRAAGRSRSEASDVAFAMREMYDKLTKDSPEKAGAFRQMVEQNLGTGLFIGKKMETKIERGDVDRILNAWRSLSKKEVPTYQMSDNQDEREVRSLVNSGIYELSDEERVDLHDYLSEKLKRKKGSISGADIPEQFRDKLSTGAIAAITHGINRNREVGLKSIHPDYKGEFILDKDGKKIRIKRRGSRANKPIIDLLAKKGVAEGSYLAKQLERLGVTKETHGALFRKADYVSGGNLFGHIADNAGKGRREMFDGIPKKEMNDYLEAFGLVADDDGAGFVDPEWIMGQIATEAALKGSKDTRDVAANQAEEELSRFMDHLNVGIGTHTNAEIKKAMDDYNKGNMVEVGGRKFFQSASDYQSAVENAAENISQAKGTGEQMLNIIRNTPGVKAEEIEWIGLDTFLKGQKSVTKQEVLDYIAQNKVRIEEVTLGKHDNKNAPYTVRRDTENNMYGVMDKNGEVVDFFDREGAADDFAESLNAGTEDEQGRTTFGTKFSQYTLPGGENYREVLLTLPKKPREGLTEKEMDERIRLGLMGKHTAEQGRRYNELSAKELRDTNFKSQHYDQANILAHVRLNDRTDADGKKVLFVEEIQSDWHQKGRKAGYKKPFDKAAYEASLEKVKEARIAVTPELKAMDNLGFEHINGAFNAIRDHEDYAKRWDVTDKSAIEKIDAYRKAVSDSLALKEIETGVPDAPLKKTWHETAFRRIVQMAATQGYDRVAWTTGEQQNERYDLSKQVKQVITERNQDGGITLKAYDLNDNKAINKSGLKESEIEDYVGKDIAEKILKELDESKAHGSTIHRSDLRGVDLKVGGEGMKGFYDKILVAYAKKFGKKFDAGVKDAVFKGDSRKISRLSDDELVDALSTDDPANGQTFKAHSIDISSEMRDSVSKGITLFQGNRGSVTFTPSGRTLLELLRDADKSTILHELGHIYLNILRQGSTMEGAPAHIKEDWEKTRQWWIENYKDVHKEALTYNPYQVVANSAGFYQIMYNGNAVFPPFNTKKEARARADEEYAGLKVEMEKRGGAEYVKRFLEGDQTDPDHVDQMILTAMDEQFARGHEAFLYEGKAPSIALQRVFRNFSMWLNKIYGSIRGLNVELNDDIRGVFQRMYASEQAIEEVRALGVAKLDPNVLEMMNKNQAAAYQKQQAEVYEAAREKTIRRALKDAGREIKQWWKDETAGIERDLTLKYESDPVYIAIKFLQTGEGIEGLEPMKIDRDSFMEQYPSAMAHFPNKVHAKGGVNVDMVAAALGFPDTDTFVTALSDVEPIDTRVVKEAKAEMNSRHGDVYLDGRLEEVAVGNVLSHEAADLIEMEMTAVGEKLGVEFPKNRDFKAAAERAILPMLVKDAKKPNRFLLSTIRMAKKGAAALAKKKYEEYASAKRKELFSINMYRMSREFVQEFDKAEDYFAKIMKHPKKKQKLTIEPRYHEMIWRVLGNFMESREAAISPEALQNWLNEDAGEMDSPAHVTMEAAQGMKKANFQTMSVSEFMGVYDLIKQLEARGRAQRTIIIDGQRRDREEILTEAVATIEKNMPEKDVPLGKLGWWTNTKGLVVAPQVAAGSMFEVADGGERFGFFKRVFKKPIDEAVSRRNRRSGEALLAVRKLFEDHFTKAERLKLTGVAGMNRFKTQVNGHWFTREELIMFGFNLGNDGNIDALKHHTKWGDEEINNLIAALTENEWKFIQETINYINTFWPDVAALEIRRNGYAPEKVEAREIVTPYGTLPGGYFPIRFDPAKSSRQSDFDLKNELAGGVGYASTQTSRSHTEARVGVNKFEEMPLLLDFNVITRHLSSVIHDLEMGEVISQTAKLLRDSRIKGALGNRFGVAGYEQIDLWLKDIASGGITQVDFLSKANSWARANATVAYMGLSLSTIVSQPSGLTNSVVGLSKLCGGNAAKASGYLARGAKRQVAAFLGEKGSYERYLEERYKKSPYLRESGHSGSRELYEANELWRNNPLNTAAIRRGQMAPIAWTQLHAVNLMTWDAAYELSITPRSEGGLGKSEADSIWAADQTVRDYQSSGLPQDLAGIMRGTVTKNVRQSAWVKGLTIALGYFMNKANRVYVHTKTADFKTLEGRYQWSRDMVLLIWMDCLITDFIMERLPGMFGGDDDDEAQEWGWWLVKAPVNMVVGLRDFAKGKNSNTPLTEFYKSFHDFYTQVEQGKMDAAAVKAGITFFGLATGTSAISPNRVVNIINRIDEGKEVEWKDFVRSRKPGER